MEWNHLNQQKMTFDGVGKYGIPQMKGTNENLDGSEWIPFNYALTCKNKQNKICHFYLDDYQFERLWNFPDKYINVLKGFRAITSPDFSMYTDYPMALQIYNRFRSNWLGAYYEEHGITVIPTLCWSTEESYEFCFDGIPQNSIVTVSNIGCNEDRSRDLFFNGLQKGVDILKPSKIYLYSSKDRRGRITANSNMMPSCEIEIIENDRIERLRQTERR